MHVTKVVNTVPLAYRMRPRTLEEFFGHELALAKHSLLKKMIEKDMLFSCLFMGPPGVGKTSLANIIAHSTGSRFLFEHGKSTTTAELRAIFEEAKKIKEETGQNTILFIDEIHRFSATQQDVLLEHVEKGDIVLIGATTENVFRELQPALVSRCMVIRLEPLKDIDIKRILKRALDDEERGLGKYKLKWTKEAIERIVRAANGDARIALNILEKCHIFGDGKITLDLVEQVISTQIIKMDRKSDEHYNLIAAWIHSTNGSDIQASMYYLARMIEAGVPLEFICRRMQILAAEDISLADPMAMVVVNNCVQAALDVGFPEASIILAQAAAYLALAPKSNSTYLAIKNALEFVRQGNLDPIPKHIADRSPLNRLIGQGIGYKYPHDYPNGWVDQQYLPSRYEGVEFYKPKDAPNEKKMYNAWLERQNISDTN